MACSTPTAFCPAIGDRPADLTGEMAMPTFDPATRPVASTDLRSHRCGELSVDDVGAEVALCGWVARRREHGEHLAFIDLRDHTGIIQCVVNGGLDARSEWVLRVVGTVRRRPEGTNNPDLGTGQVEVADCQVEVL